MTTKTTKILLFSAIFAAIMVPSLSLATDEQPMTPQEEIAMIQPHVDELYAATVELTEKERELELLNRSSVNASNESISVIEKRISELQQTIDDKTNMLAEIQEDLYERYTLEPQLKERLENAKAHALSLRTEQDIPFAGIGISHFHKALNLRIDANSLTAEKDETYYRNLLEKEFEGVPILISFVTPTLDSCSTQTSNCDPIVGGIEMEAKNHSPCTIGLPLYRSSVEGYITAGHCVDTGSGTANDVFQPTESGGTKVGDTTVKVYAAECDCAFIAHSGSEDTQEKVWYSSNFYVSVTTYTDRVANGSLVMMTGKTSGPQTAVVDDNTDTMTVGGINFDVVSTTTDVTQGGDSGAPWTSWAKSNFYGVHSGSNGSQSFFIPWENIETELGL